MDTIFYNKLHVGALDPKREHEYDAGIDFFGLTDLVWEPRSALKFGLGIRVAMTEQSAGLFVGKSGRAWKDGLMVEPWLHHMVLAFRPNESVSPCDLSVMGGCIDGGYRGELKVALYNTTDKQVVIPYKTACIQMVTFDRNGLCFPKMVELSDSEFADLPTTLRGEAGFGSTQGHN